MKNLMNIGIILTTIVLFLACSSDNTDTNQAKDTAFSKLEAYADTNGAASTPSIQDYLDAGVIGVSAENIADINEVVSNLTIEDVDTTEEIQAIADSLNVTVTLVPTPTPTPTPTPIPTPIVIVPTPPPTVVTNAAPVANAGTDQNITVGITPLYNVVERLYAVVATPSSTVRLDANNSTDDDLPQGTLTYLWELTSVNVPAITLSDNTSVQPTFELSCSDNYSICPRASLYTCTYEFNVTVSDGELSSTDSTIVEADYGVCISDIPLQ